jgi:hypothetical protein
MNKDYSEVLAVRAGEGSCREPLAEVPPFPQRQTCERANKFVGKTYSRKRRQER